MAVRPIPTAVLKPALKVKGMFMPPADATILLPFRDSGVYVVEESGNIAPSDLECLVAFPTRAVKAERVIDSIGAIRARGCIWCEHRVMEVKVKVVEVKEVEGWYGRSRGACFNGAWVWLHVPTGQERRATAGGGSSAEGKNVRLILGKPPRGTKAGWIEVNIECPDSPAWCWH